MNEQKFGTFITEPATLRKGFVRLGLGYGYFNFNQSFDENGHRRYETGSENYSYHSGTFAGNYGITDDLQLNINFHYINALYQRGERPKDMLNDSSYSQWTHHHPSKGLDDMRIELGWRFYHDEKRRTSLVLYVYSYFPLGNAEPELKFNGPGNEEKYVHADWVHDHYKSEIPPGSGEASAGFDMAARKVLYPFSFKTYAGYEHAFGTRGLVHKGLDQGWTSGPVFHQSGDSYLGSLEFNFHVNPWLGIGNELSYSYYGKYYYQFEEGDHYTDPTSILYYRPGLYLQLKRVRFVTKISYPLRGVGFHADPSYNVSLQYIL